MTATECAVSQPGVRRAPSVPGPFAADGRAVHCRGRMVDPDRPRRPALRATGRHTDLHRLGSRPRSPHPPPMPRSADGRAEDRCRPCRRHQRTTAPTAQPRPIIAVVRDHNQPQPRNAVPAHAATVRNEVGRRQSPTVASNVSVGPRRTRSHSQPPTARSKSLGSVSGGPDAHLVLASGPGSSRPPYRLIERRCRSSCTPCEHPFGGQASQSESSFLVSSASSSKVRIRTARRSSL